MIVSDMSKSHCLQCFCYKICQCPYGIIKKTG